MEYETRSALEKPRSIHAAAQISNERRDLPQKRDQNLEKGEGVSSEEAIRNGRQKSAQQKQEQSNSNKESKNSLGGIEGLQELMQGGMGSQVKLEDLNEEELDKVLSQNEDILHMVEQIASGQLPQHKPGDDKPQSYNKLISGIAKGVVRESQSTKVQSQEQLQQIQNLALRQQEQQSAVSESSVSRKKNRRKKKYKIKSIKTQHDSDGSDSEEEERQAPPDKSLLGSSQRQTQQDGQQIDQDSTSPSQSANPTGSLQEDRASSGITSGGKVGNTSGSKEQTSKRETGESASPKSFPIPITPTESLQNQSSVSTQDDSESLAQQQRDETQQLSCDEAQSSGQHHQQAEDSNHQGDDLQPNSEKVQIEKTPPYEIEKSQGTQDEHPQADTSQQNSKEMQLDQGTISGSKLSPSQESDQQLQPVPESDDSTINQTLSSLLNSYVDRSAPHRSHQAQQQKGQQQNAQSLGNAPQKTAPGFQSPQQSDLDHPIQQPSQMQRTQDAGQHNFFAHRLENIQRDLQSRYESSLGEVQRAYQKQVQDQQMSWQQQQALIQGLQRSQEHLTSQVQSLVQQRHTQSQSQSQVSTTSLQEISYSNQGLERGLPGGVQVQSSMDVSSSNPQMHVSPSNPQIHVSQSSQQLEVSSTNPQIHVSSSHQQLQAPLDSQAKRASSDRQNVSYVQDQRGNRQTQQDQSPYRHGIFQEPVRMETGATTVRSQRSYKTQLLEQKQLKSQWLFENQESQRQAQIQRSSALQSAQYAKERRQNRLEKIQSGEDLVQQDVISQVRDNKRLGERQTQEGEISEAQISNGQEKQVTYRVLLPLQTADNLNPDNLVQDILNNESFQQFIHQRSSIESQIQGQQQTSQPQPQASQQDYQTSTQDEGLVYRFNYIRQDYLNNLLQQNHALQENIRQAAGQQTNSIDNSIDQGASKLAANAPNSEHLEQEQQGLATSVDPQFTGPAVKPTESIAQFQQPAWRGKPATEERNSEQENNVNTHQGHADVGQGVQVKGDNRGKWGSSFGQNQRDGVNQSAKVASQNLEKKPQPSNDLSQRQESRQGIGVFEQLQYDVQNQKGEASALKQDINEVNRKLDLLLQLNSKGQNS